MPRKADVRLESRILDAAYRMWSERGEHALTMRAVASASGTTTPTLYERFSNKDDFFPFSVARAAESFLSHQILTELRASLPPRSRLLCRPSQRLPPHLRRLALAFARKEHMPSFEFLKRLLAAELGGKPDHHMSVALSSSRFCTVRQRFFILWTSTRKSLAISAAPASPLVRL